MQKMFELAEEYRSTVVMSTGGPMYVWKSAAVTGEEGKILHQYAAELQSTML